MVLPADDVRDLHLDVVAHDREIVERMAVGPKQDQVLGVRVIAFLYAINCVIKRGASVLGDLQSDRERLAGCCPGIALLGR